MADIKLTADVEVSKSSVRAAESELGELAKVLGSGGAPGGKKGGVEAYSEAVDHLATVMRQIMSVMTDSTKSVQNQVQLREKELSIVKEQRKEITGAAGWLTAEGRTQGWSRQNRLEANSVVGGSATAMNAAQTAMNSGFSAAGMTAAIGSMLGAALPELKPVIDAATNMVTSAFTKRDLFREAGLTRFQTRGMAGYRSDEGDPYGMGTGADTMGGTIRAYGFDIGSFSRFYNRAARGGVFDPLYGPHQNATMTNLMRAESGMNLGSEAIQLMGAGARTGSTNDVNKLLGQAVGLAVMEGFDKARMGETMTQLARAIESNTKAQTDVKNTTDRMLFIAELGPQYRGDTAASREMDQSLKQLASGATPFTQFTMLKAAGMGGGASYAEAWLKSQKGLGTQGGIEFEQLISTNFGPHVQRYANAKSAGEKAQIVRLVAQLTGMNGAQVESILERLTRGGFSTVNEAAGLKAFQDVSDAPRTLLKPRSDKAVGEDVGRFGVGSFEEKGFVDPSTVRRSDKMNLGANSALNPTGAATAPASGTGGGARRGAVGYNRTRLQALAQEYNIPVEFLEDWIRIESGGINSTTTSLNERGLFQIMGEHGEGKKFTPHRRTQAGMLGMTKEQHENLSNDPDASLMWGVKSVAYLRDRAKELSAKYKLNFNESDMLRMIKLQHGGSGNAESIVKKSVANLGHAPGSFDELSQGAYPTANATERNVLKNVGKMVIEVQVHDNRTTAKVRQTGAPGQNVNRR